MDDESKRRGAPGVKKRESRFQGTERAEITITSQVP